MMQSAVMAAPLVIFTADCSSGRTVLHLRAIWGAVVAGGGETASALNCSRWILSFESQRSHHPVR